MTGRKAEAQEQVPEKLKRVGGIPTQVEALSSDAHLGIHPWCHEKAVRTPLGVEWWLC